MKTSTRRFEIRKDKATKEGCPIRLVYQIKGHRAFIPTGLTIPEDNWSEQKAVYIKKGALMETDVKGLNKDLTDLLRVIDEVENYFEANKIVYDVNMVKDRVKESKSVVVKKVSNSKEVIAGLDEFVKNKEFKLKQRSLAVYKTLRTHLTNYENKGFRPITFDQVNSEDMESFQRYLFGLKKLDRDKKLVPVLNNISVSKQLSALKTFLNQVSKEKEVSQKYKGFKDKRDAITDVIALTQEELTTVRNLDLAGKPSLDRVRDVYVFSCATGLRYSDLAQLKREYIQGDVIEFTAEKTNHKTRVPLNPISKEILKKYKNDPRPLPIISNQKSNDYLAKVCEMAGFDSPIEIARKFGNHTVKTIYKKHELIRMHSGRKTWATISLEMGMPPTVVMKIGGWKDWKSFQRYINVTDQAANKAMNETWGVTFKNKLKAV